MEIGIDIGKERIYNVAYNKSNINNVVKWEVIKVRDGQSISLKIIDCRLKFRQGVWNEIECFGEEDRMFLR